MINLLPPKQKKELLEEEKYRLILILGVFFLFFLITLSLVLLAVKIQVSQEVSNQKILIEAKEKFQPQQFQNMEKEIQQANQDLAQLSSFYEDQPEFTELFQKISQILPPGTYLTHFSCTPPSVSLQGYSPTRDLLVQLKKNFEAEPSFKDIYFPPANWIEQKNIEFHITFQAEL